MKAFILADELKSQIVNNFNSTFSRAYFGLLALILSACGGNKNGEIRETTDIGFSLDYVPPAANFDPPSAADPNFEVLKPILNDPYWIKALEMYDGEAVIDEMLDGNDRLITYSFPLAKPDYLPVTILGWAPATQNMISAGKEIFLKLEEVLDISVEERAVSDGLNNFAISQSIQANSAGFSYFPNNFYKLGSDIYISKEYSDPSILQNSLTNYAYEVLLHEIGHALGLKHPFEGDRGNFSTLNILEDRTEFTAMSYEDTAVTFNGTFRSLDWMALTKFYGVNPEFAAENNVYKFSDLTGVFIIDGNGVDTISMLNSHKNIFIDLRSGAHSYEGQKSNYITAAHQLTISHGSDLENVETGYGNDTIIGNELPNEIVSNAGDDIIFAGGGEDIVVPGSGSNTIDFSEIENSKDTIVLDKTNEDGSINKIYGFVQGLSGDTVNITDFNLPSLVVLPIVDALEMPFGYIDNCLVRVFGEALADVTDLESYFEQGSILENLKLSNEMSAILISAASQDTGEMQKLHILENVSGSIEVYSESQFIGNYLDIDNWSADNFLL